LEYADVREERIVLYGVVTRDLSEYRYRIRATNAGTFVVPPAYGDRSTSATCRRARCREASPWRRVAK
jgi:hypothetical protein